jgi:UDPglucose 6-dehydrogenase
MRTAIFGAGPIGLAFGTVLAETGNDVWLREREPESLRRLQQHETFFESGLNELLERNVRARRLRFTSEAGEAMQACQVAFIAVDALEDQDGNIDLTDVEQCVDDISRFADQPLVLAVRTTLPVGATDTLRIRLRDTCPKPVAVAYNPVFAQEGRLVEDFMRPDRVLIGTRDERAQRVLSDLYAPYLRTFNPILFMDPTSAEVAKLSVNALLASRISFMNEVAALCDAAGGDIIRVRGGVGADSRLGRQFLYSGIGYGGPRFPRDVRDLIRIGQQHGLEMDLLRATDTVNGEQHHLLARRVMERYGRDLDGKIFAVWGLSFKAGTNDVRSSPALTVVQAGARVQAFDPEAGPNARQALADSDERLHLLDDMHEACRNAQALLVTVEWNAFRQPDFDSLKALLHDPVIFDGRNLYEPDKMKALGFEVVGVGRRG